ncbi:restriction endonuclease subunit S [Cellulomonas algicola]|uniref:restriction endonuclease subunit S n=1 Tax=Cellulomonas algicola TaxID=2071633 RepID=UPI001C3F5F91|nr:restriction endonuclease subunit S [Cellulomonas algicola]
MIETAPSVAFLEAVRDVSAGNRKVPQSEFLSAGDLAVVDQGARLIAGYTNDRSMRVSARGPLIVFGDHTRTFKYVDFPFAMGADGVKVLAPREGFDAKFVYRYLQACSVPNAGYSRHFKFLKEIRIPRPPIEEQRRLAGILDQADAIRAKRRRVLTHLDSLVQSVFHEMFGDTVGEGWERAALGDVVERIDNGTSPNCENRPAESNEWGVLKLGAVTYGVFRAGENKAYLGQVGGMSLNEVRPGDVLMTRKNTRELVGAVAVVDDVRPRLLLPDLIFRLELDRARVDPRYFQAMMMSERVRAAVRGLSNGSAASMPNISKARLRTLTIGLPPIRLQRQFNDRVAAIHAQRGMVERAIAADEELFASLQSRAFRGEL